MQSAHAFGDNPIRFQALAEVLEQMPVGVTIAEAPSGRLLLHNAEAERILRHPMLAASDWSDYVAYGAVHDDGSLYQAHEYPIARAVNGVTVPPEEMRYLHWDGTESVLLVNAIPTKDEDGNIVRAVSTFFDISAHKQAQAALSIAQDRLIEALGGGDLMLWDLEIATNRIELTGEVQRLLGCEPALLPTTHDGWLALILADDRDAFTDALSRHLAGASEAMEVDYRIRTPDGQCRWLHTRGRACRFDAAGTALHVAGSHLDITGKKQAELLLRETETKLRLAVDIAELGFWEWDIQSNKVYFSPQWKRHLGYRDDEMENHFDEWESRVHPDERVAALAHVRSYLSNPRGDFSAEFRFRHRDGSYRWIQARAQLECDDEGRPLRMIGTHLDITEHKEREEQIRQIAQHDRLTGLPNRALLFELAERALASARRTGKSCAVLFLDLDGFKPINDNYGHHIGDEVLKEVAHRLRASFRSYDIAGRFGGDEFVVIATELDNPFGAAHAAGHALHFMNLPYRIGDLQLRASASIGISLFPQHGGDIDALIRHADAAMYEAKQQGKANYRFFIAPGASSPDNTQLAERLRTSVAMGSLQLVFQPIIDSQLRRLAGAEVLLRWPGCGADDISPDVFISLAEQNGFITDLGDWVLNTAFEQHWDWRNDGLPPIALGINLSAMQFRDVNLPELLALRMQAGSFDPAYLSVEISDRALTGNLDYAVGALEKLKALGIGITLDDFGAGYSSIEQLSRLPIDRFKIDRSLIMSLPADRTSMAVTEAAIAFGKSLGIDVIAEGLESEQVFTYLQDRQCNWAQGYYFARPMPAPEFAHWYRQSGLH